MQIIKLFFIIITGAALLGGNASAVHDTNISKDDDPALPYDGLWWTAVRADKYEEEAEELKEKLSRGIWKVNATDIRHQTPLHWMAKHGRTLATQILLEYGADVNAKDKWGWTPLHRVMNGMYNDLKDNSAKRSRRIRKNVSKPDYLNVMLLLIDNGADLNAKTIDGETPADKAKKAHRRIIKRLTPQ